MILKRLMNGLGLVLLCGLMAGCVATSNGSGPNTSPTAWQQLAVAAGTVVGETRVDPEIAKYSKVVYEQCTTLQMAALAADLFSPEKYRKLVRQARTVIVTYCSKPPTDVRTTLIVLADMHAALEEAKRTN